MDALQLLGSLLGNNATSSGVGGQILGQLVNSLSGGGRPAGRGNVGGTVNATYFGGTTSGSGADIAGLLGTLAMTALQLFGQRGGASGQSPLASLAGALGGGTGALAGGTTAQSPLAALAGMLGPGQSSPPAADTAQAHQQALILVKAMINAAKADGQIDQQEQQNIISKLSDVGPQEIEFIKEEMASPLNLDFLGGASRDMATDIYAVSLMAINLDTTEEVNYMHQLAQSLGLDAQMVNNIHQQLGVAPLYS